MTGVVAAVKKHVPEQCHTCRCRGPNCTVSVEDAPASKVVIDLDCHALAMRNTTRCDYVVIVERCGDAWVAPMELKGGSFRASTVVSQLQGGADFAASLPTDAAKHFVPVLAHRKGTRQEWRSLREQRIFYRGRRYEIVAIRCGQSIADAL